MADVGNLTAKLTLDTASFSKGVGEVQSLASKMATGVGNAVGTVTKAVAGMATASAVAVGKIVNDAVKSYADYEQLVGGVETLFKESAGIVEEYANQAYKTAGISANEYMNQVTSFSASLISSLDGDTAKAAEMANQAIIDMSDNANKMGTNIESIQNAYQGFAKQNYTMLDNLKLGYGGTKEEMERLLTDAEKLDSSFTITHNHIKQKNGEMKEELVYNFADIVQAINIVQTKMDITGTTAKEASETISGSWNMVKASWQDMLTSIAGGGKGFHEAVTALIESVKIFVGNVVPVIQEALYGVSDLIVELVPVIADALPEMIDDLLPKLSDAAVLIVTRLIDVLPTLIEILFPKVLDALIYLVQQLINSLPKILDTIISVLPSIVTQIMGVAKQLLNMLFTQVLPNLLRLAIDIVVSIGDGISDNLGELSSNLIDMILYMVNLIIDNLPKLIETGMKVLLAFIQGIVDNFDKIADGVAQLITKIIETVIENLPQFVELGGKILGAIVKGILLAPFDILGSILKALGLQKGIQNLLGYDAETYGYRASGGNITAGKPYIVGEHGAELIVPRTNGYVYTASETEDIFNGGYGERGIVINIQGDIYDDEQSLRQKFRTAVTDILETELAYG